MNSPHRRLRLAALVALSLCFSLACTGSHKEGSTTGSALPDSGTGVTPDSGSTCIVDIVQLAARTACHLDDQCPCGAHCELGLCVATCRSTSDCGSGNYCDSFGRCRLASDQGLIGIQPTLQPGISLRPANLAIASGDSSMHGEELDIASLPADGGAVRLHPDPGLQLTCPGDAGADSYGDCVFPAAASVRFAVSMQAPGDGGQPQEVHVYAGSQVQTLTVQPAATTSIVTGGAPTPGTYTGQATLEEILDVPAGADSGIAVQIIPITAVVGSAGGGLALGLEDPSHTLAPFDWWTGPIVAARTGYALQLPAYRAISDLLLPDTDGGSPDVEVILEADPATLTVATGTSSTLTFTLSLTAEGILNDAGLPSATYAVVLGLVPDAGTPQALMLDGGDVATIDRDDLTINATPWANAFMAVDEPLPVYGALVTSLFDSVGGPIVESELADGGPFEACTRTYQDMAAIQEEIIAQAVLGDPAALGGTTTQMMQFADEFGELNQQPSQSVPASGNGLPPFSADGGYDFTQSTNVVWRLLAQALSTVAGTVGTGAQDGNLSLAAGGTAMVNAAAYIEAASFGQNQYTVAQGSIACGFEVDAGYVELDMVENCAPTGGGAYVCFTLPTGADLQGFPTTQTYSQVAIPAQTIDNCNAIAAQYHCSVYDQGQAGFAQTFPNPNGHFQDPNSSTPTSLAYTEALKMNTYGFGVLSDSITWTANLVSNGTGTGPPQISVTKVCFLSTPADCVERAICVSPTDSEIDDPPGPDLGTTTRANTGDLICASGPRAADFAIDESSAGGVDGGGPRLLSDCQAELEAFHDNLPPPTTATGAPGLLQLLPPASCVEAGRWIEGLELAVSTQQQNSYNNNNGGLYFGHLNGQEVKLVERIFQRWVKLHAFIAREEIERAPMAQVYARLAATNPGVVDPLGPDLGLQQDLDLSLGGWTLLLHPHFSELLPVIGSALNAPDYRTGRAPPSALGQFDQGEGLAVAILEALDSQAELATVGVNQVWAASSPPDLTLLPGFEKVFRYVAALRPLAIRLKEQSVSGSPPNVVQPAWLPAYLSASAALDTRLAGLAQALAKARSGQPAIGLAPDQIPLYFSGDVAGAGGEFSAISDYLLGGFPNDTSAWAPALVAQAQSDLAAAESAYESQLNHQLETAQTQNGGDDIRIKYGDELLNLCGIIDSSTSTPLGSVDVLEQAPANLNGASCYQIHSPSCVVTPAQLFSAYTADDLAYQVCVVVQLQASLGIQGASFSDPGFEALAAAGGCTPGTDTYSPNGCSGSACLTCSTVSGSATTTTALTTPSASMSGFSSAVTPDLEAAARGTCSTLFPQAVDPLPGPSDVNPNLSNGNCYQGALGQEALSLQSTSSNIAIARSSYADQMDAYNIAMQSCLILKQGDADIDQANQSFDSTMASLRESKFISDSIAYVAGAAVACASAAGNIGGDLDGATAAACGAAAVQAGAQIAAADFQKQMDDAQDQHNALITHLQANIQEQQCANNATQYMVGMHTQALRIQQAMTDFAAAQLQFNNDVGSVAALLSEGKQQLTAYTSRTTVDPSFDFWLSSDIQQFQQDFALAQRGTYLAVRAAEYEFQTSLVDSNARPSGTTYESEVLSAKVPQDLDNVITSLLQITTTGSILGNRPSPLSVILSMRDALLQIADQSGELTTHQLSAAQRFDEILASPKYAVYDQNGVYQGQQIPFDLAPLGSSPFGITDNQGVSIFAGNSCAERIWSVYAAIEGSNNVFVGNSNVSFAQIDLLKANTFFSQWCARPSPDGTQFQQASVDPGVNLFEDPLTGAPGQVSGFGTGSTEITYTPARLEAYFNVTSTQLAQQSYLNGQSNELAARGLYGNYALFIPAGQISLPGQAGSSAGLDLNAIDDILLRIDYVSVAN